jgi:L-threonylcarbamoyladenylate synthase
VKFEFQAKVVLDRAPISGEGLIALAEIETPNGVVRLASPNSVEEYARNLYGALRSGDAQDLRVIVAVMPEGEGLAAAIRDRLFRASAE